MGWKLEKGCKPLSSASVYILSPFGGQLWARPRPHLLSENWPWSQTAGLGRKSGSHGQARVSSLGREGPMPLRVLDGKEQAPHSISLSAPPLYQRAGPLVTHSSRVFV